MKSYCPNFTIMYFVIFFFGFLGLAKSSWAATYYVDYVGGSDKNNGTSTGTAWQHSPGDPRCTSTSGCGSVTLVGDDFVVFKGGVTYRFDTSTVDYINVAWSGTPGHPITYISGDRYSTPWGTGVAVIDGTNADLNPLNDICGVLSIKEKSYITVDGLKIQYAPYVGYTGLIGFKGDSGGNIIIENCELAGPTTTPSVSTTPANGVFISGQWSGTTPSNFTIQNNKIYGAGWHGVLLRAGLTTALVEGNEIHDCGLGPDPYEGDGVFTDQGEYGEIPAGPQNVTIRSNTFYNFPTKGWVLVGGGNNTIVEQNYGLQNGKTNVFGYTIRNGSNITFRNNVGVINTFSDDQLEGVFRIVPSAPLSNLAYYNNTVIGGSGHRNGIPVSAFYCDLGSQTLNSLIIKNNIFDMSGVQVPNFAYYIWIVKAVTSIDVDHNIYYGSTDSNPFYYTTDKTFVTWKTAINNGDGNSSIANPLLNSSFPYILQSGSPARDKGVDFSSTGFSNDKDGVSRPQGSAWDIGAYEYVQAPDTTPPATPTGLAVN